MKLLLTFIATTVVTVIISLAGFHAINFYLNHLAGAGTGEGLGTFLIFLLTIPVIAITLAIVFYNHFEDLNVTGIMFGGIFGLWFVQIIIAFIPFKSENIIELVNQFPIYFVILGYVFIKNSVKWLHITGFSIGAFLGFIISYVVVIGLRYLNNSLTSYFYFDSNETLLQMILIGITAIIGNVLEQEYKRPKKS